MPERRTWRRPRLTSLDGMGMFMGAGFAVLLLNVLLQMGVQGDRERRREQEARDFFSAHGRWPGRGEA